MKMVKLAVALAFGVTLAGTANAALITKTYQVTGTFTSGPLTNVVSTFDVTYDPASNVQGTVPVTIANFVSTGGVSFANPAAAYGYYPVYNGGWMTMPETRRLYIGGNGSAMSFIGTLDDFDIAIDIDSAGGIVAVTSMAYSRASGGYYQGSATALDITKVVVPPVIALPAAVPEPGTWAMMIGGFGLIGATARYRRRTPALHVA